ncbi:MAG TPA: PASTA domain-containing protein [Gaiellaceae bacterium]
MALTLMVALVLVGTGSAASTLDQQQSLMDTNVGRLAVGGGSDLSSGAGTLDATFDGDGKVITDFGGDDVAGGVTVQADGKIVAAGGTFSGDGDFALARYNANGSLESGFGSGGLVRTDFGVSSDFASAVAIQADGKIVAAGGAASGGVSGDFALVRYNPDGSLDSTFGGGGKVVTNLQRNEFARGLAIQPDGKIVAVGQTTATTGVAGYDFAVARYNPDGSLDASFGGVGYVITPFTSTLDGADAVLIQPDGKIVAAGVANAGSPSTQDIALARYNPDGGLDGSLDGDGKVETQDPGAGGAWGVALQADGKLVAAGGIVARYNANGALDSSFGSGGKVTLASSSARSVLVQRDQKLVVAATAFGPQDNDFLAARLRPDGSLDASFGKSGQTRTDFASSSDDIVEAAVLQADRRIVLAGYTKASGSGPANFALARYLNPPPLTCRVPNVRGKKLAPARRAVTKAHCRVGKVRRKVSKKVKRGRVISQSPKPGTRLQSLGKVNLVVSRGHR